MDNPHPGRTVAAVVLSLVDLIGRPLKVGEIRRLLPTINFIEIQMAVFDLVSSHTLEMKPWFLVGRPKPETAQPAA